MLDIAKIPKLPFWSQFGPKIQYFKPNVSDKSCTNRLLEAFRLIQETLHCSYSDLVLRRFVNCFSKGFAKKKTEEIKVDKQQRNVVKRRRLERHQSLLVTWNRLKICCPMIPYSLLFLYLLTYFSPFFVSSWNVGLPLTSNKKYFYLTSMGFTWGTQNSHFGFPLISSIVVVS